MCMDETKHQDPRLEATINKGQVVEMLHSVISIGKVNEVNTKDISSMIEAMFKEAGLKTKKVINLSFRHIQTVPRNYSSKHKKLPFQLFCFR